MTRDVEERPLTHPLDAYPDLAPPPHRRSANELQRPLLTTIDDLAESAHTARSSGRPLTTSVLLTSVTFCDAASVRAQEEAICAGVGLPWRALDDCPYVLNGQPERIAEQADRFH